MYVKAIGIQNIHVLHLHSLVRKVSSKRSANDIDMTSSVLVKIRSINCFTSWTATHTHTLLFIHTHSSHINDSLVQWHPFGPPVHPKCWCHSIQTAVRRTHRNLWMWEVERLHKCSMSMHCVSVFNWILTSSETLSISIRILLFFSCHKHYTHYLNWFP